MSPLAHWLQEQLKAAGNLEIIYCLFCGARASGWRDVLWALSEDRTRLLEKREPLWSNADLLTLTPLRIAVLD